MRKTATLPVRPDNRQALFFASSTVIMLLSTTQAFAPPPPPPPPVPIDFSIETALKGAEAALNTCKDAGIPIAVEIVDREGTARVLLAADHITKSDIATMQRDAQTVLAARLEFGDAVPLWRGSEVVGAVSVGGGQYAQYARFRDIHVCANAGSKKIEAEFLPASK